MKTESKAKNLHEKARMRAEIEAQIREYLNRGGRISVVSTQLRTDSNVIGGVWRGQFDDAFPTL